MKYFRYPIVLVQFWLVYGWSKRMSTVGICSQYGRLRFVQPNSVCLINKTHCVQWDFVPSRCPRTRVFVFYTQNTQLNVCLDSSNVHLWLSDAAYMMTIIAARLVSHTIYCLNNKYTFSAPHNSSVLCRKRE